MHLIFSLILALFIIGMLLFGFLAAKNIDTEKLGSIPKNSILVLGPMVPENVLTAVGKKWAHYRNICAILGVGGGVIYGIILRLMQG